MNVPANLRPRPLALVEALAGAGLPPFESLSPIEARAMAARLRRPRDTRPLAEIEDTEADGVPIRIYRDADVPLATIVYYHAGGWVMGGIDESDAFARDLAVATGGRIVSVGYRLAPEAPYPAPLDDAATALDWVARRYTDAPLVVMGESAGGNLAAVVAARARDRGRPAIAAQVLAYPVTDASMATPSYRTYAQGPLLTAPLMAWFWDHYLPDPAARHDPALSPLQGPLAGLPPTLVVVAEHDVLRDEGEAYAAALADAGVPVRLRCFDGQIHTFLSLDLADEEEGALAEIADFLRDTMGATT